MCSCLGVGFACRVLVFVLVWGWVCLFLSLLCNHNVCWVSQGEMPRKGWSSVTDVLAPEQMITEKCFLVRQLKTFSSEQFPYAKCDKSKLGSGKRII